MKNQLLSALNNIQSGNVEATAEVVSTIKSLPRTADNLFDLSSIDTNFYKAGALVYPVYTAYETTCNKKEGYPDIIVQFRVINKMLKDDYTFANVANYLNMLITTIEYMSPEIYEYYRELINMFKENVKEVIEKFFVNNSFEAMKDAESETVLRAAVAAACKKDVLLAEKYQALC